jgi:hypothetical protein
VHTHNGNDLVQIFAFQESQVEVGRSTHIDLGNAGVEGDVFQAFAFDDASIDFYDTFHLHQHNGQAIVQVFELGSEYVTFHDDASFDGGNGHDYINVYQGTFLGDLDIQHFENII